MKREMLYKAKRKDNKEWVYWNAVDGLNGIDIDENTVCPYSGISDKCGNKIWKNDIFKHYTRVKLDDHEYYELGVVVWDGIHCRFANKKLTDGEFYVLHSECAYEVIGNIFDNPELLEG